MSINTWIISIAFILVVTGLAWFVIYAKGWWWAKIIYMGIVLTFGVMTKNAIESGKGWPTAEQTPERFVLLSAKVDEPEPRRDDPGAIYVWLLPYKEKPAEPGLLDYRPESGEPRSFKLPYSRKMHEQMEKAMEMIRAGKTVIMGRRQGKKGGEESDEDGKGREGRGNRRGGHEAIPYDELFFYEMPPPALPEKHEP